MYQEIFFQSKTATKIIKNHIRQRHLLLASTILLDRKGLLSLKNFYFRVLSLNWKFEWLSVAKCLTFWSEVINKASKRRVGQMRKLGVNEFAPQNLLSKIDPDPNLTKEQKLRKTKQLNFSYDIKVKYSA